MPPEAPLAAPTVAAERMAGADAATLHAARRLSFGPTPELLGEIHASGFAGWLAAQLDPDSIDDTDTDRRLWALSGLGFDIGRLLPAAMPLLDSTGLTEVVDSGAGSAAATAATLDELEMALLPQQRAEIEAALAQLRLASIVRATFSRRQLLELVVDLWWNHLNVWPGKNLLVAAYVVMADREVVRPHALGRFADLLAASASSAAMLTYLDNWVNRKDGPNENYGRELLELHTVGVASGFTEHDVRDAARVFTGWTIEPRSGRFRFEPDWHDGGSKSVLGWSTPGLSGAAGVDEGRSLLEHLARHPGTAHNVATKLVRRFVADEVPAELVSSAAAVYLDNDTSIPPVLEHVLGSEAFWSSAASKVRRPLDWFVACLRGAAAEVGDPVGSSADAGRSIDMALLGLGQRPLDSPSPAGYPEDARAWLSGGLLGRWATAHELARGQLDGVRIDHAVLVDGATSAGEAVDRLLARVHGAVDPARRAVLLDSIPARDDAVLDPARLPELLALALCAREGHQR